MVGVVGETGQTRDPRASLTAHRSLEGQTSVLWSWVSGCVSIGKPPFLPTLAPPGVSQLRMAPCLLEPHRAAAEYVLSFAERFESASRTAEKCYFWKEKGEGEVDETDGGGVGSALSPSVRGRRGSPV